LLKGHRDRVVNIAFSPDGKLLATASTEGDTPVKLWDVAARREIATLHTGWVWGLGFSPDSKTLATSGVDTTIQLWDVALRQVVTTLTGHTGPIDEVAFSPDGNTLASASVDKTVRLWRAATLEEADVAPVSGFRGTGSDRSVALQWRPVPHAVAYQLYRGPAHTPPAGLVKLTPRPITGSSFTDHDANMVNGRAQTYGVAAVFRGARGASIEGPMETLQASPVAAPPGFLGSSINEGERSGSARFQPATGEIALRGSGRDIFDTADGCYFLNQPVTGDFRITVRSLTRPAKTNEWAKAGLMLRESLDAGARNVYLVSTPAHGMQGQWRATTDDNSNSSAVISHAALKLPILLRLTRRGNTITAQYSRDEGRSFQPAGQPLTFNPPLANTVYAGLAITSHDESQVSEAKFSGLEIHGR
jgi:WD40 repeat protein